jgi:hypothetical protein
MSAPTLHTATREDGHLLAVQLTDSLLTALPPVPATMPAMLSTHTRHPDRATVTAIYFHAIALVNNGWPNA